MLTNILVMSLAMGKIYDEHHKGQDDEPMLEEQEG
jgi:hypothetical protein